MASNLVVAIRIGATLGAAYRRVFQDARTQLKQLGESYQKTNRELAAADALVKYKRELDAVRKKHAEVGSSADKQLAAAKKAYATAEKAAAKYGIEVGNVVKKQGELQKKLKSIERQQTRLQRREGAAADLGSLRTRALGVGGLLYGFGRLARVAMDREEQAQYLRTVINAPDKDAAVGRALAGAREFSRRTVASDQEVIEIQYALHSAGFDEAEATAAVERVHKLAKVTRGQSGQVGEVFATTINNMGDAMVGTIEEKMDRVANVLAKTQFKFQIRDFGQLGAGLEYASAAAVAARIPLEDTAAAVGQLNSAGVQGSRAGTAFGAMMRGWTKASGDMGFELARTESGSLDLVGSLRNLRDHLDEVGDPIAVADMIQKSFGDEGRAAVVPLLEQLEDLVAARDELRAVGQSRMVDEEYDRFLRGGAAQWEMLGQNIRQVGEIFANTLLPPITEVTQWLGRQAGRVSELIERYPWVGRLLGGLALGLGLVTVAFGAWAGAVWLANAALLANPIGLVVAGIVGAAALIYSLWDPITEKVGKLWEVIKSLGESLADIADRLKNSVVGRAVRKLFGLEVDESEPLPTAATRVTNARRQVGGAGGRKARRDSPALSARGTLGRTVETADESPPPSPARPAAVTSAAAPAAAAVVVGALAVPAVATPDFSALTDEATEIARSFGVARAGAANPPAPGEQYDIEGLRAEVGALVERFDVPTSVAAPPVDLSPIEHAIPPAAPTAGGGAPAPAPGASLVFYQTFNFESAGPDVDGEIERRMEIVMRRASVEAGLAEADAVY